MDGEGRKSTEPSLGVSLDISIIIKIIQGQTVHRIQVDHGKIKW